MEINIINFQDNFEKDFYDLNIEWLEYFFQVEEYDYKVLSNSKKYIINNGGKIFFAETAGNIKPYYAFSILPVYHLCSSCGPPMISVCFVSF